jgi:excinuclease UvrABC ATPase subunit
VVFEGSLGELRTSGTLTGRHLDDRATLKPSVRTPSGVLSVRTPSGVLSVRGAGDHNLQHVDVDIPLGVLTVLTGVARIGEELADYRIGFWPRRRCVR